MPAFATVSGLDDKKKKNPKKKRLWSALDELAEKRRSSRVSSSVHSSIVMRLSLWTLI